MNKTTLISTFLLALFAGFLATNAKADPCGMVPPVWTGPGPAIERVGLQKTYVFYKDGIETFAVRPGFEGKVDDFGMLIPVPSTPAIKKIADDTFPHIGAAIDPPEIQVYVGPQRGWGGGIGGGGGVRRSAAPEAQGLEFAREDQVRVVKEEAMGMYQVVVLDAGSARALKKWMDEHEFTYPDGMDEVCQDYVDSGWMFVAIKAKVGQKEGVNPKPGMDDVEEDRPAGSIFDGHVQGLALRFRTDELVVPMRLSAYNAGDTHNVVYILSDKGTAIHDIPQELVKRQVSGEDLYLNLTQPLPLRIIGGSYKDIPDWQLRNLASQRDPRSKNGHARELFAADLLAARTGKLSLSFEEKEKELLNISERLNLRGKEIDDLHHHALEHDRDRELNAVLMDMLDMTLTVIDGDFQREVLKRDNLHFFSYDMPDTRNTPTSYNARLFGPESGNKAGKRWVDTAQREAAVEVARLLKGKPLPERKAAIAEAEEKGESIFTPPARTTVVEEADPSILPWLIAILGAMVALGIGIGIGLRFRKGTTTSALVLGIGLLAFAAGQSTGVDASEDPPAPEVDPLVAGLIDQLDETDDAPAAVDKLVKQGRKAVAPLVAEAHAGSTVSSQGWAIVALSEIGGDDVDRHLKVLHSDVTRDKLIRTWAAAGRVAMTDDAQQLSDMALMASEMPALGRPIAKKLVEGGIGQDAAALIELSQRVPSLSQSLGQVLVKLPSKDLADAMLTASNNNTRRTAAGYLGAQYNNGDKTVAKLVADVYEWDADDESHPWKGGALFLPGINWSSEKEQATRLVANILEWGVWCDRKEKFNEINQIQNNLRSLGLANAVGYRSDWGNHDIRWWLTNCGKALGKEKIEEIIKRQGVQDEERYQKVLNALG